MTKPDAARGALVVAAVALDYNHPIPDINDEKLSPAAGNSFAEITSSTSAWFIVEVDAWITATTSCRPR